MVSEVQQHLPLVMNALFQEDPSEALSTKVVKKKKKPDLSIDHSLLSTYKHHRAFLNTAYIFKIKGLIQNSAQQL